MTIRSYLEQLSDRDTPLKSGPLARLTRLTADEREELAAVWPVMPVERRQQIIEQLISLAEDNVELDFDAVFLYTLRDADAAVRLGAIRGLWEYSERDLIPDLIEILRRDPIPAVRGEAALALGRWVLLGEFEEARPHDVETITTALRDVVTDPVESIEVRSRAVEAIGASSQPFVRDIIHDAYDSGDERMMAAAVHAMGRSGDTYWLPTVLEEMASEHTELRYEAAIAAGMIEDEEAVPPLIELIERESDIEVVEQALSSLGEIGGDDAIIALRDYVRDSEDERVRTAAQEALDQAEFGDDPMGLGD